MAHMHDTHDPHGRDTRDGALVCRLCVDSTPRIDNDWCPVTGRIVCEDCCRALMMGEERALLVASEVTDSDLTPEDVTAHCTGCPRLIRLVTEHTLEAGADVRLPMH